MLEIIRMAVQVVIALGIFNVWLLRFGKSTEWRGGNAQDMRAEFELYGLPSWFMIACGTTKIILASCLLAGIMFPLVTRPAALLLAVLMMGAVSMHFKVGDPLKKALPAAAMLLMSLFVGLS